MQNLTEQIQTEVRIATARAIDEAASLLTKRINEMADKAVQKIIEKLNARAAAITEKVKAADQEIVHVKDDIHFERGFRKFFFWVTPIMLLIQTVAIIILAI